jgi:hypothetical protein
MYEPTTALDAYKDIIDQLAGETRLQGAGWQVAKSGIYSNAPAHNDYNKFIRSLSPQYRTLIARMLQDERDGAIHDVLAALTWWIIARGVGLTFRGKPMPVQLSGAGLHGDYVGRMNGWEWPQAETECKE